MLKVSGRSISERVSIDVIRVRSRVSTLIFSRSMNLAWGSPKVGRTVIGVLTTVKLITFDKSELTSDVTRRSCILSVESESTLRVRLFRLGKASRVRIWTLTPLSSSEARLLKSLLAKVSTGQFLIVRDCKLVEVRPEY